MPRQTLAPEQLQRVIVRAGGLWSISDIARFAGEGARRWPQKPDFPHPAWKQGQMNLYTGWSLYGWMEFHGHYAAARTFHRELTSLRVRPNW